MSWHMLLPFRVRMLWSKLLATYLVNYTEKPWMSVLYDTISFIKRLHLLVGATESKFKKIIDQKAWWTLVVDLDSLPNSQWRHNNSWSGRLYDCLSDGGCFWRVCPQATLSAVPWAHVTLNEAFKKCVREYDYPNIHKHTITFFNMGDSREKCRHWF